MNSYTPPTSHSVSRTSNEERTWATLAHLAAAIAWVLSAGWLNIVGPLVIWLLHKDRSPFVRRAASGAVNFTILSWLLSVIGWILTITVVGAVIGVPLLAISAVMTIVFGVLGALKTWNGESYDYPFEIKILN